MSKIRIATRQSRLALWQAEDVARRLTEANPGLDCELVQMTTEGDRFLAAPLGEIGGKGLFIKELEQALFDQRADIAVHSMKDVTVTLPPGLAIPVYVERGNPFDAVVSKDGHSLTSLPPGARIGSSSLRRQSQIRALRSDLEVHSVRGNVDTRLRKLDEGEYDALILACAGLERLGLDARISERIGSEVLLPAIGQGAMGIECREDDGRVLGLIEPLNDPSTAFEVRAERAMNTRLAGGCHVPVAGFAQCAGGRIGLRGLVASLDGRLVLRAEAKGETSDPEAIGEDVAAQLVAIGANDILADWSEND